MSRHCRNSGYPISLDDSANFRFGANTVWCYVRRKAVGGGSFKKGLFRIQALRFGEAKRFLRNAASLLSPSEKGGRIEDFRHLAKSVNPVGAAFFAIWLIPFLMSSPFIVRLIWLRP